MQGDFEDLAKLGSLKFEIRANSSDVYGEPTESYEEAAFFAFLRAFFVYFCSLSVILFFLRHYELLLSPLPELIASSLSKFALDKKA